MENYGDVRQGAWCVHCGTTTKGSRDHIPSKVFLDKPYPANLPTLDICGPCNHSFSRDEEYAACFLECVVCGTTDPDSIEREKIAKSLKSNPRLRERIDRSKTSQEDADENEKIWLPEWERISNALLKNALGHVLYELNEQAPHKQPSHSMIVPFPLLSDEQRKRFESNPSLHIYPEVGSRAFQRMITGEGLENGWIVIQPNRYRYQATAGGWIMIKIVIREYLAVEFLWEDDHVSAYPVFGYGGPGGTP